MPVDEGIDDGSGGGTIASVSTDAALAAFVGEVGATDPVVPVGGRTQWGIGGSPAAGAREVRAPAGIIDYQPAEMVVRCRAGTTVAELDATLAEHGQMVPLDPARPSEATVGGVLAVGRSGLRRLRYGPLRDTLLQVRFVSAAGRVVTAGGAVVKNVSGFDLCRLLVGSLGTLGILGEVVLRAQPRPRLAMWLRGEVDPRAVRARLFRPSAILWDGTSTWVLLEGRPAEVAAERQQLDAGLEEVEGPPPLPSTGRLSIRPREIAGLTGRFVAEVGVGTVHVDEEAGPPAMHPSTARLHRDIKAAFDPAGRLNPGRSVASG